MKKLLLSFIFSIIFHLLAFNLFAQINQSFIYGTITTYDDRTYTGQIRWGEEEAFWTDHFNALKLYNDPINMLSEAEIEKIAEKKVKSWGGDWGDNEKAKESAKRNVSFIHELSCQFGEIQSLDIKRVDRVEVTFRDGNRYRVSGEGYNDIGTEVIIHDPEKGEIELDWLEIINIQFIASPANFVSAIGDPIHGTVKTNQGEYSGFIQWDKDERLSKDHLDGNDSKGRHKIEFGDIAHISKVQGGSKVKLIDGTEYTLKGTNDVNSENRGIIISNPNMGRVTIDWDEFEEVRFTQNTPIKGATFADFKQPKRIEGEVKTKNGKIMTGKIVFDLDEQFDFEILNGDLGEEEFSIPFKNIKKIEPQGKRESLITLQSNETLRLTASQDVNAKNDGLLVFENEDQPTYIPWEELEYINLK